MESSATSDVAEHGKGYLLSGVLSDRDRLEVEFIDAQYETSISRPFEGILWMTVSRIHYLTFHDSFREGVSDDIAVLRHGELIHLTPRPPTLGTSSSQRLTKHQFRSNHDHGCVSPWCQND